MNALESNVNSNGATPGEKVKQILAITPILKNQKSAQQSEPSQQQSEQKSAQPPQQSQEPQSRSQQAQNPPAMSKSPIQQTTAAPVSAPASGGQDDLIDFDDHATSGRPTLPPNTHFTQDNLSHSSLQEPLQPSQPLKRRDTNSDAVDEFVDADDGT